MLPIVPIRDAQSSESKNALTTENMSICAASNNYANMGEIEENTRRGNGPEDIAQAKYGLRFRTSGNVFRANSSTIGRVR